MKIASAQQLNLLPLVIFVLLLCNSFISDGSAAE